MSNKVSLKLLVAIGLLAMLLIFLGVNSVPRISAVSSAKESAVYAAKNARSDYIERHPSAVARLKELARTKDEVFPVDDRLTRLDRLHELAGIKDEVSPMDFRSIRLDRLHELAEIKAR